MTKKPSVATWVDLGCGVAWLCLTGLNVYLHGFHRVSESPREGYSTWAHWQFWSSLVLFGGGIARIVDQLGRQKTDLTTLSIGASSDSSGQQGTPGN